MFNLIWEMDKKHILVCDPFVLTFSFLMHFLHFVSGFCFCFISGFVCLGVVGELIMQFVQLFSPSSTAESFEAKETNHLFVFILFFTLHTQYICNVAYPCKIMMYHSYLPWL